MATTGKKEGEKGLFDQDPLVERLRPEPSAPPSDVVILEGLAGKSDREGWARLYFNLALNYYAEFRREDIVFTEAIPSEQSPIAGHKATQVGIKNDAIIEYTRATRAKTNDQFDLDVQFSAAQEDTSRFIGTWPQCPRTFTCANTCLPTCMDCRTVDTCHAGKTCVTCGTCRCTAHTCDQHTCGPCPTPTLAVTCATCQCPVTNNLCPPTGECTRRCPVRTDLC